MAEAPLPRRHDHRAAGGAVRLYTFLANRSLWLDELMLAENIIDRDFGSLLAPLANQQVAPRGA